MDESLIEILLSDDEGISREIKDSEKYLKNEEAWILPLPRFY